MPYDPKTAVVAITGLASSPFILAAPKSFKGNSLQDVIAAAKAGQKLSIGHGGNGTLMHLTAEMLLQDAHIKAALVAYRGMAPVVNAADVPAELHWRLNDLPAALAMARQQHRNVLIDFTGYTCTNCRWMEANMFTRPEIKVAMNQFVLARLYTDGDGEMYERQQMFQQRQFGTIALPLYAIVDADGNTVRTFAGLTRSPNAFLAFLASGRAD